MAAFTSTANSAIRFPVEYGRSGYNSKPSNDDDETKNRGRSGYNKGGKDDEDDE